MNRLSELAGMFLLLLIGMNTMIYVFAPQTETVNIVPSESDANAIFQKASTPALTTTSDPVSSFVRVISLPWDFITGVYHNFRIVGAMLFGYEAILNAMHLPTNITSFVTIISRALVLILLFVVGLQIISSLQGGGSG